MAKTSAKPLDALDFLAHPEKHQPAPVCVLFGDEGFLQRQVLAEIKQLVLSGDDAEFSTSTFDGNDVELRDVLDALSTRALFGGGRHLVVIEEADDFVSKNRPALETYAGKPKADSVLVLLVKLWPATTRLYKALAETGLQIECRFPPAAKLLKWLVAWSKKRHDAKLEPDAAERLTETLESDLGLYDQELAKLAALAGPGGTITAELVDEAVGGWRAKSAWEMLDAALDGNTATALAGGRRGADCPAGTNWFEPPPTGCRYPIDRRCRGVASDDFAALCPGTGRSETVPVG
jgi:DNA polymerase-3 subunit delta